MKYPMLFGCLTAAFAVTAAAAHDGGSKNDNGNGIKTVFVIALENNNWVQPNGETQFSTTNGNQQQIFKNPVAPFINSLVAGTDAPVTLGNGRKVKISQQLAYATNYHNVLATASGANPHIHPSEPNYFWAEAGTNYNIFNDDDPFAQDGGPTQNFNNNQDNQLHLVRLLEHVGATWRSYQEDIDLTPDPTNKFTNIVLPRNQWTVPLTSLSGTFPLTSPVNEYNGSRQFDYAAKHNPQVFFTDSNGGNDPTPENPLSQHYAPLQQLVTDLARDDVADYNWITPNQHNDMHSSLSGGFKGITGQDAARIAQGDNFLSIIIPRIMSSRAYQDHGAIIIWTDETEPTVGDVTPTAGNPNGPNPDDLAHSLLEFVISPDAHPNVNGVPYASPVFLTHSSDLRTIQKIFGATKPFFIGDAIRANDLSDLFAKGVIPRDGDEDDDDHGNSGKH